MDLLGLELLAEVVNDSFGLAQGAEREVESKQVELDDKGYDYQEEKDGLEDAIDLHGSKVYLFQPFKTRLDLVEHDPLPLALLHGHFALVVTCYREVDKGKKERFI